MRYLYRPEIRGPQNANGRDQTFVTLFTYMHPYHDNVIYRFFKQF